MQAKNVNFDFPTFSPDVWDGIIPFLTANDLLLKVGLVCKTLLVVVHGDYHWQQQLERLCPRLVPQISSLISGENPASWGSSFPPQLQVFDWSSSDSRFLIGATMEENTLRQRDVHPWLQAYRTELQRQQRWRICAPTQRYRFKAHSDGINCLALNRTTSRTLLASGSFDRTIKVWLPYYDLSCTQGFRSLCCCGGCPECTQWVDVHNSTPVTELQGHTSAVWAVDWLDSKLASASFDRTVRLWDIGPGQEMWCGQGHRERVLALSCNTKSGLTLTGGRDGALRVWDLRSHLPATEIVPLPATPCIYSVQWAGDQVVLAGTHEGFVLAFDIRFNGLPIWQSQAHAKPVLAMDFCFQKGALITASKDYTFAIHCFPTLQKINPNTGPTSTYRIEGHRAAVRACQVAAESQLVVSASNDHLLKMWQWDQQSFDGDQSKGADPESEAKQITEIKTLRFHQGQITSLCCDNYLLLSGSIDGTINVQCFGDTPLNTWTMC